MKDNLITLPDLLLPWFYENKRELPWRQDKDPYHIWVSEIMLQQTRVEAVKGYYRRFIDKLPSIQALANADDDALSKLWEGLGYYSRMRNLKKAAQVIMQKFDGIFPRQYEEVRSLPGIGDYTAGAICSIAYDQKTPAVDGNVLRVYTRLMNDPTPIDLPAFKKAVTLHLKTLYPENAGDFTQALMELGATVCGPNRKPQCQDCPCKNICKAHQKGCEEELPVKLPKKARRQEALTVFILNCDGKYAIEKRSDKGLLAGLWQFPNTPGHLDAQQSVSYLKDMGIAVSDVLYQKEKKHIFTHIQWNMRGFYISVKNCAEGYIWLPERQIEDAVALPTAFRQFWEDK